jgi:TonB family protein
MRLSFILAALLLATSALKAGLTPEDALFRPRPKYPYWARAHHITGSGICVLELRPDGTVRHAEMVVSTGNAILDDAALEAYRQWRFVPGKAHKVKIPVTFWMLKPAKTPKT